MYTYDNIYAKFHYFCSMSNNYFQFKQFTVWHNLCAMKVGTDGVLLGSWASCSNIENILDIGTGSGLIALMLAQRSNALIDAIDIDENAYQQASINISNSPFPQRISVFHAEIQSYKQDKQYDLIVCNPPFFSQSLKSPDKQRNYARHDNIMPFEVLFKKSASLLKKNGKLALIIPTDRYDELNQMAIRINLHLYRICYVKTRPAKTSKRLLLEYGLNEQETNKEELVIELDRHVYSSDYISLTQDFYINM